MYLLTPSRPRLVFWGNSILGMEKLMELDSGRSREEMVRQAAVLVASKAPLAQTVSGLAMKYG